MAQAPPSYRQAAERWGYLADAEAHKWGLPNGATLLLKIAYVESSFTRDLGLTSSAGAKGPMQFMPATRQSYLEQYGVDAWASIDQALHAAALFMKTQGLEGYNPGGPGTGGGQEYISKVLGAPVRAGRGRGPRVGLPSRGPTVGSSGDTSPLLRFLLTIAFAGAGIGMIGLGISKLVGASRFPGAAE